MNKARLEKEFSPFEADPKAAKETGSSKDTTLEAVQEKKEKASKVKETKEAKELSIEEKYTKGLISENEMREMVRETKRRNRLKEAEVSYEKEDNEKIDLKCSMIFNELERKTLELKKRH